MFYLYLRVGDAFTQTAKDLVRDLLFDEKHRVDGRSLNQVRPISCDVNMYSPLHGSSMFQRGQTQVLCTVTLDSLHSAQVFFCVVHSFIKKMSSFSNVSRMCEPGVTNYLVVLFFRLLCLVFFL